MKARIISRESVEVYVPQWNEERTKFGLTEIEQNEYGYKHYEPYTETITPKDGYYPSMYYEEIDGVIYEKIEYKIIEQINE